MIKMTCNTHDVITTAKAMDRLDNFGIDGWLALFQYMEGFSEDIGEDIELDIVAWCCDFTRYESLHDYNKQRGTNYDGIDKICDEGVFACMVDDAGGQNPAFITFAH